MGSFMVEAFSYFRLEPYVKPATGESEVRAGIHRTPAGLALAYEVTGAIDELVIPPPGGLKGEELWAHTCFELFVRGPDGKSYWEWNFSPTLRTNFFSFSDYRKRSEAPMGDRGLRNLNVQRSAPDRLIAKVEVASPPSGMLQWLFMTRAPLQIGITMVLETKRGELQYWAAQHSGSKADFHRAEDMIISL